MKSSIYDENISMTDLEGSDTEYYSSDDEDDEDAEEKAYEEINNYIGGALTSKWTKNTADSVKVEPWQRQWLRFINFIALGLLYSGVFTTASLVVGATTASTGGLGLALVFLVAGISCIAFPRLHQFLQENAEQQIMRGNLKLESEQRTWAQDTATMEQEMHLQKEVATAAIDAATFESSKMGRSKLSEDNNTENNLPPSSRGKKLVENIKDEGNKLLTNTNISPKISSNIPNKKGNSIGNMIQRVFKSRRYQQERAPSLSRGGLKRKKETLKKKLKRKKETLKNNLVGGILETPGAPVTSAEEPPVVEAEEGEAKPEKVEGDELEKAKEKVKTEEGEAKQEEVEGDELRKAKETVDSEAEKVFNEIKSKELSKEKPIDDNGIQETEDALNKLNENIQILYTSIKKNKKRIGFVFRNITLPCMKYVYLTEEQKRIQKMRWEPTEDQMKTIDEIKQKMKDGQEVTHSEMRMVNMLEDEKSWVREVEKNEELKAQYKSKGIFEKMITKSPFKILRIEARKRAIRKWNKYVMIMKDFISAGSINGNTIYLAKLAKLKRNKTLGLSNEEITSDIKKQEYEKCCLESFKEDILFINDMTNFNEKLKRVKPDEISILMRFLSKTKDKTMQFLGLENWINKVCPDSEGDSSMIALKSAAGLKSIFDNNSAVVAEVEVSSGRGGKKKTIQKKIKINNTLKRKRKKKIKRNK